MGPKDLRKYYTNLNQATRGHTFPLCVLDKLAYFQNIAYFLKESKGKPIRIATKSLRVPFLIQQLVDDYSQVKGVMSFHGAEAIYLASLGIKDILLGYPIIDKQLIMRIGEVNQGKSTICLMVDCKEHLEVIEAVGKKLSVRMPVCIDIDLSTDFGVLHFGVWRSPIRNEKKLIEILTLLNKYEHIQLVGLMGYEAQIAGVPDKSIEYGLKNILIRGLKSDSIRKIQAWRKKAIQLISDFGVDLEIINGGGTGSISSTRDEDEINELTIGSGFYGSHFFDNYRDLQISPALFYGLEITRNPMPGRYTCHAGGYIASGQIERLKQPKVYLPPGAKLISQEGAGEVQTPFSYRGPIELKIGQPIFMRHAKAGELLEHFNEIYVFEDGVITERLQTYRGFGLSFS